MGVVWRVGCTLRLASRLDPEVTAAFVVGLASGRLEDEGCIAGDGVEKSMSCKGGNDVLSFLSYTHRVYAPASLTVGRPVAELVWFAYFFLAEGKIQPWFVHY